MKIPAIHETTAEERTWAALSHISIIIMMWGVGIPLIIWLTQRKKSAFVAFHALQALTYQLFQMAFWMVWSILVPLLAVPLMIVGIALTIGETGEPSPLLPILTQFGIMGALFCGFVIYLLPSLLGTILIFARRDFHYPLFGAWLRHYLSTNVT